MNRLRSAASLVLFALMPLIAVQACGPDFFPDVFVRKLSPGNPKEFAQGKLGLLLPTYTRADLAVAYRYLNGGTLNATEQSGYLPTRGNFEAAKAGETITTTTAAQPKEPKDLWQTARSQYPNPPAAVDPSRRITSKSPDGTVLEFDYANCLDDAFKTAAQTLQARAKTWGTHSPELANWLAGQDAVFSNCSGPNSRNTTIPASTPPSAPGATIPIPAPEAAPALLRADRAYQIAAAHFYGADFPAARAAFEAIHQDTSSPWQGIAGYLTARCLVRQAFLTGDIANYGDFASFNAPVMNQAADLLRSLLKEPNPPQIAQALRNELDMVRFRTEPAARLGEVAAALGNPTPDPDYAQHLQALDLVLNPRTTEIPIREDTYISPEQPSADDKGAPDPKSLARSQAEFRAAAFNTGYQKTADLRANTPLIDWLLTFQSPSDEARTHAIDEWRRTHQLAWLVAAIAKAGPGQTSNAALLFAAAQIAPTNPAWETVTYHRARLLLALNRAPEARQLLDRIYPEIQTRATANASASTTNAFLGLRLRAAANLGELLKYAPQQVLERTSESQFSVDECSDVMKDPKRKYDCKPQPNPTEFSADAASFFNNEAPLGVLVDATSTHALPENLRQSLALTAWVRSVLLKDDAAAARLLPILPAKLQQQAGPSPGPDKDTGIRPIVALVRNPGLRPWLDPGVQRAYSYDFVESYRDNWWCGPPESQYSHLQAPESWSSTTIPAAMLDPAQRSEARRQLDQIESQGSAQVYLGSVVLAYANAHPDDPDVPEDLYLVLRMIRYGCASSYVFGWNTPTAIAEQAKENSVKQSAARLLRQRYRTSPWTKKAAPIAG